ncbi:MAG: hypothetical protein OCD76_01565 [Reichenbachiella sp.]
MRKSILSITASIILLSASTVYLTGCSQTKKEDNSQEHIEINNSKVNAYSCPMHPEITGLETDKCSKCGMALTETNSSEGHDHSDHE